MLAETRQAMPGGGEYAATANGDDDYECPTYRDVQTSEIDGALGPCTEPEWH